MPLTMAQFCALSPTVVASRLALRHMHYLAVQLCKEIGDEGGSAPAAVHWACQKIANAPTSISDDQLYRVVTERLATVPRASYTSVAQEAYSSRREDLAQRLLEREPLLLNQVNALISFDLLDEALRRAISASDTDLLLFALKRAKQGLMWPQFFELIQRHPQAMKVQFYAWERSGQHRQINSFLSSTHNHAYAGRFMLRDALAMTDDFKDRLRHLGAAKGAFDQADGPTSAAIAASLGERIQLEVEQSSLSHALVGRSLRQTIFDTICRGEVELGDRLAQKFHLKPRPFYLTKIKALVASHAWAELERMASDKAVTSKVGLSHFFHACMRCGQREQAMHFAARIRDAQLRMEAFIELEIWDEAAELALSLRDETARHNAINEIRKNCHDPREREIIEERLRQGLQSAQGRNKAGFLSRIF